MDLGANAASISATPRDVLLSNMCDSAEGPYPDLPVGSKGWFLMEWGATTAHNLKDVLRTKQDFFVFLCGRDSRVRHSAVEEELHKQ